MIVKTKLFICVVISALVLCSCKSMNEPDSGKQAGTLPGKFSISAKKQVQFSQGNLQYQASTNTWRFAENQYDIIGNKNKNVSIVYDGWIDTFGWGTGYNPTNTSEEDEDYATFVDWGYNAIINGGNEPKMWRTLTSSEWNYIFFSRPNANVLFGFGMVNGISGLILLPDSWKLPNEISFTPSTKKGLFSENGWTWYENHNYDNFSHNTYTSQQWNVMESAGAVFLPAAGFRSYYAEMSEVGMTGFYWSSTWDGTYFAYSLQFDNKCLNPLSVKYHVHNGRSVRLVH